MYVAVVLWSLCDQFAGHVLNDYHIDGVPTERYEAYQNLTYDELIVGIYYHTRYVVAYYLLYYIEAYITAINRLDVHFRN